MIVGGQAVAEFVSDRLGFGLVPPYTAVGIERDGEIVAGVLFNCYEGASVHVTAAGKGWTREFLKAIGSYVYDQLGCARMTMTTESEWVASLACRLGGQREGLLRDHFGPSRNAIIVGILRREWKFGRV